MTVYDPAIAFQNVNRRWKNSVQDAATTPKRVRIVARMECVEEDHSFADL